jgi:hypothetical protein
MTDTMPVTITETAFLDGGDSQWIAFRPAVEGAVSLRSVLSKKPTHSELGLVGIVSLFPPGTDKPVATVKVKLVPGPGQAPVLALSHVVTGAELAAPGDWRFQVFNGADEAVTFATEVTYLGPIQLDHRIATIDVAFLGSMLAEAVTDAGVSWHLESTANQEAKSWIRWSNAAAAFVGSPLMMFAIDDIRVEHHFDIGTLTWVVLRLSNLDSDPLTPVSALLTQRDGGVPVVLVTVPFAPDTAQIVAIDSDVDLDQLSIEADVSRLEVFVSLDFSGTISATSSGSGTITVAGQQVVDIDSDLTVTVPRNLNAALSGLEPAQVRQSIDKLFRPLMRLGPDARVEGYQSDGTTLTVHYAVPVTPPTGPRREGLSARRAQ